MREQSENAWRDSLPKASYFDKSIELVASFDRLMVTLFSALIAGITVMLLKQEVSLWVGASLLLALVSFSLGIGHTLLHVTFTSKMLLLAETLANNTQLVPNAIEGGEPTPHAFARNQAYAQRSFTSQLVFMMIGISFAAISIVIRLWEYAWRAGVIGLAILVVILVIAAMIITWNKTLRRFQPSTMTPSS
ncbi:hypothetical protein M4951_06125 [Blastopirellula sp. J2-11]|uniref:hypothetical protein n=1 Tax=Blastopirellula sp. J2-11 TaxID=2943192 RepID=UPI0021C746DF|nr:hypothetical protein [Blastopirellula sp. J2-11]UUO07888.1 hypothetical protein M4951_06125 [Blastopirellula sp. J2-11]